MIQQRPLPSNAALCHSPYMYYMTGASLLAGDASLPLHLCWMFMRRSCCLCLFAQTCKGPPAGQLDDLCCYRTYVQVT